MMIDTHCHFDFYPFIDQTADCVERYQQAGVSKIIVPAVSIERFAIIQSLAHQFQSIYYALGLHPMYYHNKSDLNILVAELDKYSPKRIAIGEIGLDSYAKNTDQDLQSYWFMQQLDLAKQYRLPVILHSRKTHAQLCARLREARLPNVGVIHGFSGSYEQAIEFIRLGFAIGVGGVISYPRASKTRDAIRRIPLSSIVLETDAPDMPLYGQQGLPNRPEYVASVLAHLAALRSQSLSVIRETVLNNSFSFFPGLVA